MPIDPRFTFSANNLQDYLDCPRRFELKYLLKQSWPAEESEPVLEFEHNVQLGSRFHQTVFQYLNGLPLDLLQQALPDPELQNWLANFLAFYGSRKFERIFPEFSVRFSLQGFPCVAVFDLLGLTADRELWILDWKTSGKLPRREVLAERVQSILYPYAALQTAPAFLRDIALYPENVHMAYVYVHHERDNVLVFDYDAQAHLSNGTFLEKTVAEILAKEPGAFDCTADERRCKFCVYRSLCERGERAGSLIEMDMETSGEEDRLLESLSGLDFDAQEEIAF